MGPDPAVRIKVGSLGTSFKHFPYINVSFNQPCEFLRWKEISRIQPAEVVLRFQPPLPHFRCSNQLVIVVATYMDFDQR